MRGDGIMAVPKDIKKISDTVWEIPTTYKEGIRVPSVHIQRQNDHFKLSAEAYGEELNPCKHELIVDVKAVTLHRFQVEQTESGWRAMVILDI
ncbi:MAG: archease [Anaerolineae bacterium]|nr:MAG: archease [Anaerolineae bacterium]